MSAASTAATADLHQRMATQAAQRARAVEADPTQMSSLMKMVENPSDLHAAFEVVKLLDGTNTIERDDGKVTELLSRLVSAKFEGAAEYAADFAQKNHVVSLGVQLLNAGYTEVVSWLSRRVDAGNPDLMAALRRFGVENGDLALLSKLVHADTGMLASVYTALDKVVAGAEWLAGEAETGAAAAVGGVDATGVQTDGLLASEWSDVIKPVEELAQTLFSDAVDAHTLDAKELLQQLAEHGPSGWVPKFVTEYVASHGKDGEGASLLSMFAGAMMQAGEQSSDPIVQAVSLAARSLKHELGVLMHDGMDGVMEDVGREVGRLVASLGKKTPVVKRILDLAAKLDIDVKMPSWRDCCRW